MNAVYEEKSGKYYALIVPDLVRSFTITFDVDYNDYNRIRNSLRFHAYVDRLED